MSSLQMDTWTLLLHRVASDEKPIEVTVFPSDSVAVFQREVVWPVLCIPPPYQRLSCNGRSVQAGPLSAQLSDGALIDVIGMDPTPLPDTPVTITSCPWRGEARTYFGSDYPVSYLDYSVVYGTLDLVRATALQPDRSYNFYYALLIATAYADVETVSFLAREGPRLERPEEAARDASVEADSLSQDLPLLIALEGYRLDMVEFLMEGKREVPLMWHLRLMGERMGTTSEDTPRDLDLIRGLLPLSVAPDDPRPSHIIERALVLADRFRRDTGREGPDVDRERFRDQISVWWRVGVVCRDFLVTTGATTVTIEVRDASRTPRLRVVMILTDTLAKLKEAIRSQVDFAHLYYRREGLPVMDASTLERNRIFTPDEMPLFALRTEDMLDRLHILGSDVTLYAI